MSSSLGPEANLLAPGPESCRQLALPFPIIDNDELAKIIHANDDGDRPGLDAHVARVGAEQLLVQHEVRARVTAMPAQAAWPV